MFRVERPQVDLLQRASAAIEAGYEGAKDFVRWRELGWIVHVSILLVPTALVLRYTTITDPRTEEGAMPPRDADFGPMAACGFGREREDSAPLRARGGGPELWARCRAGLARP